MFVISPSHIFTIMHLDSFAMYGPSLHNHLTSDIPVCVFKDCARLKPSIQQVFVYDNLNRYCRDVILYFRLTIREQPQVISCSQNTKSSLRIQNTSNIHTTLCKFDLFLLYYNYMIPPINVLY